MTATGKCLRALLAVATLTLSHTPMHSADTADTLTLRVMTYNIHAGHDAPLAEIAKTINGFKPDFVALEEVDHMTARKNSPHQNGRNFTAELANATGMMGLYGKTMDFAGGFYGIAMLTRYPYVKVDKLMLPNPDATKEPRALLEALVELPGGDTIVLAATHLEAFSKKCRKSQGEFLNRHYAACHYPVVIGGDFNASPTEPVMDELLGEWQNVSGSEITFSTTDPHTKIDYLLARPRGQWRVVSVDVPNVRKSDHLPVMAVIQLIKEKATH